MHNVFQLSLVSLTELVATLDKEVTADEVNAAVKESLEGNQSFGYNADEIVSSNIIGTEFGSVFEILSNTSCW